MYPHDWFDLGKLSYDDGFFTIIDEIIVEVRLNYAANVKLMDKDNYKWYREGESYEYYGGHVTRSPYRIKVPYTDYWILVVDNGGDDMDGIEASARINTRSHDRF